MGFFLYTLVFPTQVGVILDEQIKKNQLKSIPHASGGDPIDVFDQAVPTLYSPRKWG